MATINWPWAIILCTWSDMPVAPQPVSFYQDLYTRNGAGGLCDYWRAVSSNTIDLTGSQVFGWFPMSHASSELVNLHFPGDRATLVQWGKDTANANGVNLTLFRQVLVVMNYGVDHGAANNGVLIVHHDPAVCEFGFISHEMGHGFGLPHSYAAPNIVYGDGWDVMSWQTTTWNFPISFQGAQGLATVGLNARNLQALNCVPAGRTYFPAQPDFSHFISLDPLNQTPIGNHGFLIASLSPTATNPVRTNGSVFTAEFRQPLSWDQAIPQAAVIIHEIRTDGLSYLQPGEWGQFTATQTFVTPDPKLFIYIASIDNTAGFASLRIWDIPEGCLRKEDNNPKVYLIQNGQKRWVTSPQVLTALGKTWADVRPVPDHGLDSISNGPDVVLLSVSVSPYPIHANRSVTLTVSASDVTSGAAVAGQVVIDDGSVFNTNTAFTHIFRTKRKLVSTDPRQFEIIYPKGLVRAAGYPDTAIDFGFPDL